MLAYFSVGILGVALSGNPGVTGQPPALPQLLAALLTSLVALTFWRRSVSWFPRISLFALGLLGVSLLSCLASPAPYLSCLQVCSLVGFLGVVSSLELGAAGRSAWFRCAAGMVLCGSLSSGFGLARWAVTPGRALSANFTNPDCYSLILLISFFLSFGLMLFTQRAFARLLGSLVTFELLLSLLLSESRAGLAGLLAGYCMFLFTLSASSSERWRRLSVKLLLVPSLLALALFAFSDQLVLVQRLAGLARGEDPVAIRSRWDVLRLAPRTLGARPFGVGSGCFHLAYQEVRPPLKLGEDYMNVAHNDYVQWLVETGIVGLLMWMGLLLSSFLRSWYSFQAPPPLVSSVNGCLVGIGVYCSLNFATPVPADLFWIGGVCGLSGALYQWNRPTNLSSQWSPKRFSMAVGLVILALWSGWYSFRTLRIERAKAEARQLEKVLDWEAAYGILKVAQAARPEDVSLQLAIAHLCRKAFLFSGQPEWNELEEDALSKAQQSNPLDLQVVLTQIDFLQQSLLANQAQELVQRAERLAPYSPIVRRARARNEILLGQYERAAETLADLERVGLEVDDLALAELLALLEKGSKGKGQGLLRKASQASLVRARSLGLRAAQVAVDLKDTDVAIRLLKATGGLCGFTPEVQFRISEVRGLRDEKKAELKLLDSLRRASDEELPEGLAQRIWQRWCKLQIDAGRLEPTIHALDEYLVTHPRENWARLVIADAYLRLGRKSEARAAMRDGIGYDDDGSLRVKLGDLCVQQGLPGLAKGYYNEALPLVAAPAEVRAKLESLKEIRDDEGLELPAQ